jgi:hypothetical protein
MWFSCHDNPKPDWSGQPVILPFGTLENIGRSNAKI